MYDDATSDVKTVKLKCKRTNMPSATSVENIIIYFGGRRRWWLYLDWSSSFWCISGIRHTTFLTYENEQQSEGDGSKAGSELPRMDCVLARANIHTAGGLYYAGHRNPYELQNKRPFVWWEIYIQPSSFVKTHVMFFCNS